MRQINDGDLSFLNDIFKRIQLELFIQLRNFNVLNLAEKQNLFAQIAVLLDSSKTDIYKGFVTSTDSIYNEASNDTLQRFTRSRLTQTSFSLIDKQAIRYLFQSQNDIKSEFQQNLDSIMGNAKLNIKSVINNIINQSRSELSSNTAASEVSDILTSSKITGENAKTIQNKIVSYFENNGIRAVQYPSTRTQSGVINYSIESQAKMLTQSSLIRSSTAGVLERSMELGHDIVRVSSHADPSPMCQPYAGKKYSISGKSNKYPALSSIMWNGKYKKGSGIHHPYCRHSLTIAIESDTQLDSL